MHLCSLFSPVSFIYYLVCKDEQQSCIICTNWIHLFVVRSRNCPSKTSKSQLKFNLIKSNASECIWLQCIYYQDSKLPQQSIKISTEIQLNQIKFIWRHWTSVCLLSGGEIVSAKHQNLNWNSTESNQIHLNAFDIDVFIIRWWNCLSKTSKYQLRFNWIK